MRIALLLLVALSACRTRHQDVPDAATTLIRDDTVLGIQYVFPGKVGEDSLALGSGRPAPMYSIGGDGSLTPIGTAEIEFAYGSIDVVRSPDTGALWFLAPQAVAALHWRKEAATRIELGLPPVVKECGNCSLELVGTRQIVPTPGGGALVVRNFADRPRTHKYCEVQQLAPNGVLARTVFPGFGAPVRTLGTPSVMVSEATGRTRLHVLGQTGWWSRDVVAATYEGWVEADGALYRLSEGTLVRVERSAADQGSTVPFSQIHPLAIAPARDGGLWAVINDPSVPRGTPKPPQVLVRLEYIGPTSTSPPLPADAPWCQRTAPEELGDGTVAVPCRMGDGRVTSVDVLVDGQWRKLRSAKNEATRVAVDRILSRRETALAFAPWLDDVPPFSLWFVHLLFIIGLRLANKGGPPVRKFELRARSPVPALLGAAVGFGLGWAFGVFEQIASGWSRNDSLMPSLSNEMWWIAKLTAALAGMYLGLQLARPWTRRRTLGFLAVCALVPVTAALGARANMPIFEGSVGAWLIGFIAFFYGLFSPRPEKATR